VSETVPSTPPFTTRPQLAGTFGMVASTHWLASAAGMSVLEKGGNAFDAAVAAGFVLQVVEPHLNGPGGEVPVVAYDTRLGQGRSGVFVLDGQGPAPAAATLAAFADLGLDLVPGSGLLAAVVPAAFGTWMLLLERHGTMRPRDVLEYAIGYARDGYPMLPSASAQIEAMAGTFRAHWPTSAEVYLGNGVPGAGERFANPVLAATYSRILEEAEAAGSSREAQIEAARRAFYEGFVAEAITAYLDGAEVMDVTGQRHRGLLAGDDLAGWRASAEEPATLDFRGFTVCKTGPWGQGPVFLQQLAQLDALDLAAMGAGSADFIHAVTESCKLAMADREAWYGDPRFSEVPLAGLLSAEYAAQRRALIGDQASAELIPGAPAGVAGRLPGYALAAFGGPGLAGVAAGAGIGIGIGEPTMISSPQLGTGDTCHLDVADRFGNLVSATPSGGWLQSSPVVPGLGFCLGSRAQMFALTPGFASSLAPGRRPRTTLSPSLALRDGEPYLAFGTPGGDQQDQWTLAVFLNHAVFGMNLQEAIDFPAFHTDHMPSSFYPRAAQPRSLTVESRVGEQVVAGLRDRGHDVSVRGPWSQGRVSAVSRSGGFLYAGANPRGMQGYAAGR
jgi:gamma-glutamyltranspeptidase/glutathione hydrolase